MTTEVIREVAKMQQFVKECKRPIGFIPTMGNLHAGHESLIAKSVEHNEVTIVCIVLSPILFNNPDHFIDYPRTFNDDLKKIQNLGVDVLFVPGEKALFPDNYAFKIIETDFSKKMEGQCCSTHFDGALAIILKLLCMIKPDHLYLGEKDYQQLELVRAMCQAFFLDVKIVSCPTIRNAQGLAWSSRNNLLTEDQKKQAIQFPKILQSNHSTDRIKQLLEESGFYVEYIEDYQNRRFGAVRLGSVRLIDNFELKENYG